MQLPVHRKLNMAAQRMTPGYERTCCDKLSNSGLFQIPKMPRRAAKVLGHALDGSSAGQPPFPKIAADTPILMPEESLSGLKNDRWERIASRLIRDS